MTLYLRRATRAFNLYVPRDALEGCDKMKTQSCRERRLMAQSGRASVFASCIATARNRR